VWDINCKLNFFGQVNLNLSSAWFMLYTPLAIDIKKLVGEHYHYFYSRWAYSTFWQRKMLEIIFHLKISVIDLANTHTHTQLKFNSFIWRTWFSTQVRLIWFMNEIQRINYRIEFRTIYELVRFVASPNA